MGFVRSAAGMAVLSAVFSLGVVGANAATAAESSDCSVSSSVSQNGSNSTVRLTVSGCDRSVQIYSEVGRSRSSAVPSTRTGNGVYSLGPARYVYWEVVEFGEVVSSGEQSS